MNTMMPITMPVTKQLVSECDLCHEEANAELWRLIPKDQIDEVLSQDMCDIDGSFLGFVGIYKQLSIIVPRHFTVVDLGCGYNAQSYFFQRHKRFVGVDNFPDRKRFIAEGTEFVEASIHDFIKDHTGDLCLDQTFAICSYVPPWGHDNIRLTREYFKNVFTYYPSGGHDEAHL